MTIGAFFASLRGKLLLFSLALVVVPGVVFGLIAYASARRALQDAVGRMLAEVAHDSAAEVNELVRRETRNVRVWARQDLMQEVATGDEAQRIARFLASLKENDVGYRDLLCIDLSGRVVAASTPSLIGSTPSQGAWHDAFYGQEHVAGPAPFGEDGVSVLTIAAPIHDPADAAHVIGVLLGWYDWDRFTAVLRKVRKNSAAIDLDVDVALLDGNDSVIASAGARFDHSAVQGTRLVGWAAPQRSRERHRPGYLREASVAALVGYARVKDERPQWVTLVAQQPRDALAPIYRMRTQMRWLLTGVLVSALGVAIWLADRMSRPLRELTAATKAIARGGAIQQPVLAKSHDEIGELAAAFNTMTRELKEAQEQLVTAEKFAFVGEVAAGIAHEVRTPLGILRSSAQILGRSIAPDQPKQSELIEMMIGEVDRLDRVVAGLLEISRSRDLLIEPTPLSTVLNRALDFADAQARAHHITVKRDLIEQRPARCDPEQIYQVALNLIVNALHVLPAGGVLTVRSVSSAEGRVGFAVSDTGPGIAPDALPHIFTPFFSQRSGGTGLGLALVQRVIRAHGGTISVVSKVGEGSTFRVELPAEQPI